MEIVRKAYDAFNRGDFDRAIELAHPEIEVVTAGGVQPPIRGTAALRTWMEPDAIQDQRIEPLEFRSNGNKVLVRQRTHGRGSGSGIELDVESWVVWTLDENGLATQLANFLYHERNEALEAAGLSE